MNRLIIIGNGFDIAHGYKTSYKDFIHNYLKQVLTTLSLDERYEDELLIIKDVYLEVKNIKNANLADIIKYINNLRKRSKIKFKSGLLNEILNDLSLQHWVDIEQLYYNLLVQRLKGESYSMKDDVTKLNSDLDILTRKLKDYLNEIFIYSNDKSFRSEVMVDLFTHKMFPKDIKYDVNYDIKTIFFLNFNYTDTIYNYTNQLDSINQFVKYEINNIHGEIKSDENPLIFGYDNDSDQNYLELKNIEIDAFLDQIKSFKYLNNNNYKKLVDFINNDLYDVQILGHSLGASDRTLLTEIFNHENCKAIEVFYHQRSDGTDDFDEKLKNISRCFEKNSQMNKLVSAKNRPMSKPKIIR